MVSCTAQQDNTGPWPHVMHVSRYMMFYREMLSTPRPASTLEHQVSVFWPPETSDSLGPLERHFPHSTVIVNPWGEIGRKQQTCEKTTTGFRRASGVYRAKYMRQRCFNYMSYGPSYYCPRKWEMNKITRCVTPCCPFNVTIQTTGSSQTRPNLHQKGGFTSQKAAVLVDAATKWSELTQFGRWVWQGNKQEFQNRQSCMTWRLVVW